MSNGWARLALTGYRCLGAAIYPFLGTYLAYRATRGKEERPRRHERYGFASAERPVGPLVWFHAASVGETTAVIPLIDEIYGRGISVVLTTGTVTSAAIARERLSDRVIHQYVPLDLKPAVSRFLDYWQPDLAIIAESEIWPMTILELGARRVPQVLVNGRMSDKSFRNWCKRPGVAEALLENLSHVVAQSDIDAERFRRLGARPVTISGNIKVDVAMPKADPSELARLRAAIGGRRCWAAISTFEGEEKIAADAHRLVRSHHDALTIIVPRHTDRADDIEQMLRGRGLVVARRTRSDPITPETDVYLGDTIGEMGLYLNLADIVFVGKSLRGKGGQNPLEPAMVGCAILTGRHVGNFRETYQKLAASGGAKVVKDETMLAKGVDYLMANDAARVAMIAAGKEAIAAMRGALPKTIQALEPFISPLAVQARLQGQDARLASQG